MIVFYLNKQTNMSLVIVIFCGSFRMLHDYTSRWRHVNVNLSHLMPSFKGLGMNESLNHWANWFVHKHSVVTPWLWNYCWRSKTELVIMCNKYLFNIIFLIKVIQYKNVITKNIFLSTYTWLISPGVEQRAIEQSTIVVVSDIIRHLYSAATALWLVVGLYLHLVLCVPNVQHQHIKVKDRIWGDGITWQGMTRKYFEK